MKEVKEKSCNRAACDNDLMVLWDVDEGGEGKEL